MTTKVTYSAPPGCCLIVLIIFIVGCFSILKFLWNLA